MLSYPGAISRAYAEALARRYLRASPSLDLLNRLKTEGRSSSLLVQNSRHEESNRECSKQPHASRTSCKAGSPAGYAPSHYKHHQCLQSENSPNDAVTPNQRLHSGLSSDAKFKVVGPTRGVNITPYTPSTEAISQSRYHDCVIIVNYPISPDCASARDLQITFNGTLKC